MKKSKYNFYLNPHDQYKWTKCPKCDGKTKVRKFCLMINYEEKKKDFRRMMSMNKSCKFCPYCELIIAQKSELDILTGKMILNMGHNFMSDNYFVFGTMERKDWKQGQKEPLSPDKALDKISPFKDFWDFEIRPAGWYFDG